MTTPTTDIWISNMYQSGSEIAGYQSGKYLHQNYLNTNSVLTACFLPWSSLPLTGDACSVPDTECSIFLNFPNCLIFYVSNCLILQPPLPSPPPLPIPIKYMKIHNYRPIKSKSTDFFFHFVYSR